MIKWLMVAVFLVISVVLLSGHGAWLIAGYNTAGKEQKAAYDEKKLCRATGVMTLIITVETAILCLSPGEVLAIPYLIALCITIALSMVYINLKCKRK